MRISDWSSDVCSSDLLQVAYYLGFKEVILIGMDHRYEYTGDPNQTQVLDGPDLNHFSSDYFGHGQHWDNPDLAHSEESYRIARAEYERDEIGGARVGRGCVRTGRSRRSRYH